MDDLFIHTGLLLLRVRDEIRMTTTAYQTLYESAIAWGMRKALESEQGKADMEKKIELLDEEKKELERQVRPSSESMCIVDVVNVHPGPRTEIQM